MKNTIIKVGEAFWTGSGFSREYPDAQKMTETCAQGVVVRLALRYKQPTKAIQNYGLESETVVHQA